MLFDLLFPTRCCSRSFSFSLAAIVVAWCAPGDPALAACTPATSPIILQDATVTCSGATSNQNGSNGYGTSFETGLTVNVLPGASVNGTNAGILITSAAVNNDGIIMGGIRGVGGAGQLILTNTGTISGATGASGFDLSVVNSGSITGTGFNTYGVTATILSVLNSGTIQGYNGTTGGTVSVTNSGSILATGFAVRAGTGDVTVFNSGTIWSSNQGVEASGHTATVVNSGTISGNTETIFADIVKVTNSGLIEGRTSNGWAMTANSSLTLINTGTLTGGVGIGPQANVINAGTIAGHIAGINVGNLTLNNSGVISGNVGILATGSSTIINSGTITSGSSNIAVEFQASGNVLTLAPGSVISGRVLGSGTDTLQFGGTGAATFDISGIGSGAQYQGFATFNKVDASTWTLTGTGSIAGAVNVDRGVLEVNGALTTAAGISVKNGGTLSGAGLVTSVTINPGGTLAPGNGAGGALHIGGDLAFASGAIYLVQLNPAASANITGVATLGGATVNAVFTTGGFAAKRYKILSADGGVSSAFSPGVGTDNPNLRGTLSYDANNVYLGFVLKYNPTGGLNFNQQAVGNALTRYFDANGGIPVAYAQLSPAGLSQVAGEFGSASQQTTFDAMSKFMGVMTDPFIAGRGDPVSADGGTTGYADERSAKRNPNDALSAIYTKAPSAVPFQQRWSVWAVGFGGSQTTDGNTATASNTATSRVYGTVIGSDYRFSPFTIAGFSLAGGGTNFSVVNNGNGRSDLFQAGAFIRHNVGAAYLSGALAYGWQDITTDRTVTIAGIDQLRARFNANAWSGRLEGGYRFVAPFIGGIGFTPYAAGQFATFELPAYAEGVISGANTFALVYGAKSVADSRSELGLRTDKSFAMQSAILTLRGRLAWAHDFNPDRGIGATFLTLPGASFFVNGAAQASDSALVTASAETRWMNGWSTAATFEGEFSNVTRSYAGKGVVRYAW